MTEGLVIPEVIPFSDMDEEERRQLLHTLSNPAWYDDEDGEGQARTLDHPVETIRLLATVTCDGHLASCVPAVRELEGRLEPIPMSRIRNLLIELYGVDKKTAEDCRRRARERLRDGWRQDAEGQQ